MSGEPNIKLTKDGHIATVTFCDPSGLNLLNKDTVLTLAEIQEQISQDNQLRVVIVNSSGAHFSAGVDTAFLKTVDTRFVKDNLNFLQRTFSRFQELPIPVICAIKGFCLGGGLELALSCDIRVAAEGATLALPEVRFGLTADQTGTTRLTKLVGIGQAKKLILCCEMIDAAESYRIGLVEYLVKPEELDDTVMKLAKRMVNLPPSALRFGKWGVNVAAEGNTYAALMFEQAQSIYCFGTTDKEEAVNAFIEKRKPVYNDK
jgi:enoyl-CoA hydratase